VPRRKRTEYNDLFRLVVLFENTQDPLQSLFKLFQTLFVHRQTCPIITKWPEAPFRRTTSVRVVGAENPKPEGLL